MLVSIPWSETFHLRNTFLNVLQHIDMRAQLYKPRANTAAFVAAYSAYGRYMSPPPQVFAPSVIDLVRPTGAPVFLDDGIVREGLTNNEERISPHSHG